MNATIEVPLWMLALAAIVMIALLARVMRGAAEEPASAATAPERPVSRHRSPDRATMRPIDRTRVAPPGADETLSARSESMPRGAATARNASTSRQTHHPGRSPLYTAPATAGPDRIESARIRAAGIGVASHPGGRPRSLAALHDLLGGSEFASMREFAIAAVRDGGYPPAVVAPLFRVPIWRVEEWVEDASGSRNAAAPIREDAAYAPATGSTPRAMSARVAAR